MEGAETLRKTQRTEGGALVAFAQELAHNAYGCDRQLKRANETELARIGQISDRFGALAQHSRGPQPR